MREILRLYYLDDDAVPIENEIATALVRRLALGVVDDLLQQVRGDLHHRGP